MSALFCVMHLCSTCIRTNGKMMSHTCMLPCFFRDSTCKVQHPTVELCIQNSVMRSPEHKVDTERKRCAFFFLATNPKQDHASWWHPSMFAHTGRNTTTCVLQPDHCLRAGPPNTGSTLLTTTRMVQQTEPSMASNTTHPQFASTVTRQSVAQVDKAWGSCSLRSCQLTSGD